MNIGPIIRTIRKHKGLTQQQGADLAGMARSRWCDVERDRISPTVNTVDRMMHAMGIDLQEQVTRHVRPLLNK